MVGRLCLWIGVSIVTLSGALYAYIDHEATIGVISNLVPIRKDTSTNDSKEKPRRILKARRKEETEESRKDNTNDKTKGILAGISNYEDGLCARIFNGDEAAIDEAKSQPRFTPTSAENIIQSYSNCSSIQGYVRAGASREETRFPLAYTVQMYISPHQMERLLKAIYRPHNVYCINVDATADPPVTQAMTAIAACFPNVILSHVDVMWGRWSQVEADLVCMEKLLEVPGWKYVLSLTGQEFPLKTNRDLVTILRAMNGSNVMPGSKKAAYGRMSHRWKRPGEPPVNATLVKGACHWAVTRSFVEFVLHDEIALTFRSWAKQTRLPDEIFFQSLSYSPQLGVPGASTGLPEPSGPSVMRHKIWLTGGKKECAGKRIRSICILGVGDLQRISSIPLFLNKVYDVFQPATLQCLEERHIYWTSQDLTGHARDRINVTFYEQRPNVINHIPSGLETAS